ncbi:MAG: rhodanese-related sulfurtransferase [Nostocales cyanobacterium]|nr:MAG: rhodanese-related sulfurtransferase [Nostocales cyanobacterium]
MTGQSFREINVQQLAQRLAQGDPELQLIDVREPQELALSQINGFVNLPLSEYEQWNREISKRFDPHAETLVLCHHGMRSAEMCQWLVAQGFTNVKNITGGIAAYSILVDPSVPQY